MRQCLVNREALSRHYFHDWGTLGTRRMGTGKEAVTGQEEPAHLQLAAAAALSLLALWVISRVVEGRRGPGPRGSKGQVPSGDECASVHVVGENIMSDEFTEQQHQVKELHPLALTPGVRWTGGNEKSRVRGARRPRSRGRDTPEARSACGRQDEPPKTKRGQTQAKNCWGTKRVGYPTSCPPPPAHQGIGHLCHKGSVTML